MTGALRAMTLAAALALVPACREHAHEPSREQTHEHHAAPSTTAPSTPAANPVQHEMRLLVEALQAGVLGVGTGDVRPVAHALHRVHEAKAATEAAIHDGRYRPPRNADRIDRFHALDEAFHHDLEGLVEASSRNDVDATARALGAVMQGCNGCHTEFRQ